MILQKCILPIVLTLSFSAIGQRQVGITDPNAVVLTFKSSNLQMNEFSEGLAVLRDGNLSAVMDSKGKITIPYTNSYSISPFKNGYARVQNSSYKEGYIDSKGKIIIPLGSAPIAIGPEVIDAEGYYQGDWVTLKSVRGEVVKFPVPAQRDTFSYSFNFHDGLCTFGTPNSQGYVNRKGVVVIKKQFKEASDFSEGLAAVERTNVGERKWGFIDKSGKTIIPYQFSSRPGDFSNGLSHVVNREGKDSWINKKGEVKIRMPDAYSNSTENFKDGVVLLSSYSKYALLDTMGNLKEVVLKFKTVKNGNAIDERSMGGFSLGEMKDKQIIIKSGIGYGLLDINGNIIIPPVFDSLSFLDPVSGLARASFSENNQVKDGYVNSDGVFVIIAGKASEW